MARSKATSSRVEILGGAYQSRAIISSSQRSINLYPESNAADPQAPSKVTHFPTPGLVRKASPAAPGVARCLYEASNGELFEVVGPNVYYVDQGLGYHLLGTIPDGITPVSMADNGLAIVIVGGSTWGYAIKMSDHSYAVINDPPYFLGGTFVWFMDSYFIFNTPGTSSWQISLSYVTFENLTAGTITPPNIYAAFDPLDVAQKTGYPDAIMSLLVVHLSIWLLGVVTTENWVNTGAADFTFGRVAGVFTQFGSIATYSQATQDLSVFWLSRDRWGKCIVLKGDADYSVSRVSTYGLEAIFQKMATVNDAIGACYQLNGHPFYVLIFPTENRSFMLDIISSQWTEIAFTSPNGLTRHRGNCWVFAYGMVLCGDYQNGDLYEVDSDEFTDFGNPITRLRTIPHIIADGRRFSLKWVMVDLQGGTLTSATPENPPEVTLRISVDRGATFVAAPLMSMGAAGEYETMPVWRSPSGVGRDIVLEISWSAPIDTALNGIFYDAEVTELDDI